MFGRRITLFELLGFKVNVDATWILLALLVTWSLASGLFPAQYKGLPTWGYWAMGIGGAVGLFVSIIFHEFCHSIVARRYSLPIKGITLFIFGGVAEMEEEPASPKTEFLMAIAGPLSSIALALLFVGTAAVLTIAQIPAPIVGVFQYLGFINGLLAGFNLIPAFPLDGGRVFRAALWHWKQDIRAATRITSQIGSGFGMFLIIMGVVAILTSNFVSGMWWFLIGMFLRGAASSSYQQLLARQIFEGEPVRKFMTPEPVTVGPDIPIEALVDDFVYRYHHDLFPVLENGHLLGCVSTKDVKDIPREDWARRSVREVMTPCADGNTIEASTDAVKALSVMHRGSKSRLMVTEGGRLVGVLALKDMMKLLSLKLDLEEYD